MSFLGIFFKTHHIDSDIKMRCKTVMEKCVLKLTNQEKKYSLFSSLLLWYSFILAKFIICTKLRLQVVGWYSNN